MPRPSRFVQDVDHVAAELVSCLPALARAVERQIGPHVEHPKPSEAQIALLRHVEANDGATVRRAAEALLMKPNNVSALVTQLTEQGLLEQPAGPCRQAHRSPAPHLDLAAAAHRGPEADERPGRRGSPDHDRR